MGKVLFQIAPLDCSGCAKKIENLVNELKGIESVNVFPRLGKIRIVFDGDKMTTQQIEETISLIKCPTYSKTTA